MEKVVAVLRAPVRDVLVLPDVAGLRRGTVDVPEGEVPPDIAAVLHLWLDDARTLDPADLGAADAWLVDERVQWDYERDWPDGEPTPGVKQVSFVHRLPSLTREEFAHHWTHVHAPLARVHHPALWRYVQNVVIRPLTDDAPEFDGVAELSFRTSEDRRERMYDSPEGAEIVGRDVRSFIDLEPAWRVFAREWVLQS